MSQPPAPQEPSTVSPAPQEPSTVSPGSQERPTAPSGSQERPTVLVVDDEEDLRDILRRMLERRGFTTLVAGDFRQAIQTCQQHPGEIDVLLTDLGLPGVSGGDLARDASQLRPNMRVVYISGSPKDLAVADGLIDEQALLVRKPFTGESLVSALTEVLGTKQ